MLRAAFEPHVDRDWSSRAGDLDWTCLQTLLHACDFWYSVELATQASTWLPPVLTWRDNVDSARGLAAHDAAAALLSAVIRGMRPNARAFHGQRADASGFAAMHCDEVLVHGFDIAQGLGIDFSPPSDLVAAVRDRLFPWSPRGDPWATLLWCNGRIALPDHERLVEWSWHPAPLVEWDGSRPSLE